MAMQKSWFQLEVLNSDLTDHLMQSEIIAEIYEVDVASPPAIDILGKPRLATEWKSHESTIQKVSRDWPQTFFVLTCTTSTQVLIKYWFEGHFTRQTTIATHKPMGGNRPGGHQFTAYQIHPTRVVIDEQDDLMEDQWQRCPQNEAEFFTLYGIYRDQQGAEVAETITDFKIPNENMGISEAWSQAQAAKQTLEKHTLKSHAEY